MSLPGQNHTGATGTGGTGQQDALGMSPTTATSQNGTDFLDKGIDGLLKKSGHGQSHGTTEKISDGIRSVFKKVDPDSFFYSRQG